MYEYRYCGGAWQPCDAAKALEVLSTGYFDPTPVLEHVDDGNVVVTTQYEVRRKGAQARKEKAQ